MGVIRKNIRWIILVIILMIIVSGVSVYATNTYLASQVTYKDGKTVEEALNELYNKQKTKKIESIIPNMTSNSTPYGTAFTDYTPYASETNPAYYAFDSDLNTMVYGPRFANYAFIKWINEGNNYVPVFLVARCDKDNKLNTYYGHNAENDEWESLGTGYYLFINETDRKNYDGFGVKNEGGSADSTPCFFDFQVLGYK